MRTSRWSEQSVDKIFQEHEVMKEADANQVLRLAELSGVSLLRIL